ncbi:MAG: ABC transporter permease subunit [Verrucomicrobia bacterium]|nr:ABC transporter permease subunit [Verrucomicrobiota bacterium]MBV9659387.1 ABC transporter permease subunit [Verrucomicrobiota bacterium]
MRSFFVLLDRELKSYFYSPLAYIILTFFLILTGYLLGTTVEFFQGQPRQYLPFEFFFNNLLFWIAFLLTIPIITMRLYSEEFKLGTIEPLMTAPVRDWQVVAAKFFGALLFFLILWAPTATYFGIFQSITGQAATGSAGAFAGSYLILLLMGMFYISIGCLASVLTQNQIIAAIVSLVTILLFFFIGIVATVKPNVSQNLRDLMAYTTSVLHMQDYSRGVLDTRPMVFYTSMTLLLQFITYQVFQYRKWQF